MLNSYTLLFAQCLAHLSVIPMILYAQAFHWWVSLLVYFFMGCVGMSMTYHRLLSHKSWRSPVWFRYFGVVCGTLALTGSVISWCAIHRKHHHFSDQEKDPHSPKQKGFIYCQWFSMFSKVEVRYVLDLLRVPFFQLQHRFYFLFHFTYAFILFLIDPLALIYAWLFPACVLWNIGSLVVSFSHMYGSRPHKLNNNARNHFILGLISWGEGWHNNHHYRPSRFYFGERSWQWDIAGLLVKALRRRDGTVS